MAATVDDIDTWSNSRHADRSHVQEQTHRFVHHTKWASWLAHMSCSSCPFDSVLCNIMTQGASFPAPCYSNTKKQLVN